MSGFNCSLPLSSSRSSPCWHPPLRLPEEAKAVSQPLLSGPTPDHFQIDARTDSAPFSPCVQQPASTLSSRATSRSTNSRPRSRSRRSATGTSTPTSVGWASCVPVQRRAKLTSAPSRSGTAKYKVKYQKEVLAKDGQSLRLLSSMGLPG